MPLLLPGPCASGGSTPGLPPSGDGATVTFTVPGSTVDPSTELMLVGEVSAANCCGWIDPLFKPAMYAATCRGGRHHWSARVNGGLTRMCTVLRRPDTEGPTLSEHPAARVLFSWIDRCGCT